MASFRPQVWPSRGNTEEYGLVPQNVANERPCGGNRWSFSFAAVAGNDSLSAQGHLPSACGTVCILLDSSDSAPYLPASDSAGLRNMAHGETSG